MSEKQIFNKDIQNRQIAEKRRERWMSRKILTEILETIRLQKNDANWILYQVFTKENLTYKSKNKIWNHLMRAGYDLAKEKPQKENKTFSYKEAWQENKKNLTIENIRNACLIQKMAEENYKLKKQLNEANEIIEQTIEKSPRAEKSQWCKEEVYRA